VAALLDCYGLAPVEQRLAATTEEAGALAASLGGAVALKAVAPGLVHKTDVGAVRLNLHGADDVASAAREMQERLRTAGHSPESFLVQRMAPAGVEMIVGITQDPQFGPIVVCGAGGVTAELLRDASARLSPLTARDAAEMVRDLRTYPLLTGFRGAPPADVAALEEVILRLSALAEDLPQVAELDCNPVLVLEHGVAIVDARVRVAPTEPPRPLSARR
jgi:acyl-CoA synthetase (NDP forming)